jgi:predicted acetyltransferase
VFIWGGIMKKIQIVSSQKMEEMRKYFYEYLIELSEFDKDIKFDENNIPIYKWFNCYWEDKDRYPLYLIVDDVIAGFALIREMNNMSYDFAEFYILPEYRKDNNALWFALEITNLFPGEFTFSTRFTNPRAIKFWSKFAKIFESNEYVDDDTWRNWTIRKIK